MEGSVEFVFGLSHVSLEANANQLTSEACTRSLSKLKGVAEAQCVRESFLAESGIGSYLLTFVSYPLSPFESNMFSHNGNPPFSSFYCNGTLLDREDSVNPYCELEDIPVPSNASLPGTSRHRLIYDSSAKPCS